METENNAAPAGESAPEPMSLDLDAAASALEALEAPEQTGDQQAESQTAEPSAEDQGEQAGTEADEPTPPDEESEPDTETDDDEIVHGNKLVVLRNGEKVRIGDLKKLHGLKPELERQQAELTQRTQQYQTAAQQLQAQQAQFAQQAQILQQLGPVVLAKAQAMMPLPPNRELIDRNSSKYDPVEYMEQKENYEFAVGEFRQIQQGIATFTQQKQQELSRTAEEQKKAHEAEYANWVENEHKQLIEELPELRDQSKSKAFAENIVKGAKAYGYTEADLKEVKDRRIMKALADLGQYQALRSQKTVVEKKVASAPPVRAPGKRQTDAEQVASARKSAFERANSGSIDDVAAAIAALHL